MACVVQAGPRMTPASWQDLGVGIAAIVANLFIVLAFLKFLTNHLSQLTRGMEKMVESVEHLRDRCERLENEVQLLRAEFRGRMSSASRQTDE